MNQIRRRLTYANVMSSIAVFLVIGGATAFAALGKNTVGSKQLKKNAVTASKIKNGAVTAAKVNVTGFPKVPSAGAADSAANATHATNADNAGHATNADNATHATNADNAINAQKAVNAQNAIFADSAIGAAAPEFLASGETETGVFYGIETPGTGNSGYTSAAISFPFPLESPPTENYLATGALPTPACPGTAEEPEAAPGNLCAYESVNTGGAAFFDGSVATPLTRFGDGLASSVSGTSFNADLIGTWAVTAP